MKNHILSCVFFAGCLAAAASAQTPTIVHGQKVLLDKYGHVITPPASPALPPAPLVGGADSCVTPDVLTGLGAFSFDNTTATTGAQGQNEGLCLAYAVTGITNDVWFKWTAPYTGTLAIDTCAGGFVDSKIAAYPGTTCPTSGSALACNDDYCGLQSQITIPVTNGNSYVFQVGNYPSATGVVGILTLTQPPPPPSNDSCTTPIAIVGSGPFSFDTTSASTGTEGQTESLCNVFGNTGIGTDVWYTWVAPFSGTARVSLCGQTSTDTKIAAYAGTSCPTAGSALACNDNACNNGESQIDFAVTSGSAYMLQVGDYPFAIPGPGTFTINPFVPATLDDCQLPVTLAGPGTYAFDSSVATDSSHQSGNCADVHKDLWYTYAATMSGSATITTCGMITSQDVDTVIAVYAGAGCPSAGSIACDDDDFNCTTALNSTVTWPTVCGQVYAIQVGAYNNAYNITGSFSITETGTQCGPTGVPFCFGDGTGTACPCANSGSAGHGCASSVNANGAVLTTSGFSTLASDTLALLGSGMPNSSCLYFQGTTQISVPFGDGLRCAGGSVTRLGTKTNVAGASQYPVGADPSVHVRGGVTVPGTRTYQVWYRNAAAYCTPSTFNLSNGILITWQ